jgi:two-component system LytT family response regulator
VRAGWPDGSACASRDWIEATGDYVSLQLGTKTHLLRGTMASLEARLDPRSFVRIHRSTIVQIERVRQLCTDAHGDYAAVLRDGRRLRVGRKYREGVLARLGMRW